MKHQLSIWFQEKFEDLIKYGRICFILCASKTQSETKYQHQRAVRLTSNKIENTIRAKSIKNRYFLMENCLKQKTHNLQQQFRVDMIRHICIGWVHPICYLFVARSNKHQCQGKCVTRRCDIDAQCVTFTHLEWLELVSFFWVPTNEWPYKCLIKN